MKEKVEVHEEDNIIFVFRFKEQENNHTLHSGPWFYQNSTLQLVDYDSVGDLKGCSLDLSVRPSSCYAQREGSNSAWNVLGSFIRV